ncbi:cell division initiation protein [Streptacidiphilus pinicola]|uniref:Cell division initiation protein n=1 Tax=Streptacidiphilus pinicola TaxID=2219663 RepID=A0A2X0J5X6_9ACTN|nr:cell division initiation protein [Streptacidiphilus pinicola]RAG82798.1 cell division initiation protein [Streptacidiphilus pinicola]
MDVQQKLDEITKLVEGARSMPMSASIVVNRTELVGLLTELREDLPGEIAKAQETVQYGDQVVEDARREAERVVAAAHEERQQLINGTDYVTVAQAEADRVLGEARAEAAEQRREADDYVDSKLANFEVVLTKTLGAIGRGREKLRVAGGFVEGEDGEEFTQDQFRSPNPEVDEYVDVKLAALETALSKTLEAVGRGRDKLLGKRPIDELGAYLAAADEAAAVEQGDTRQAAVAAELSRQGLMPSAEQQEQHYEPQHHEPQHYEPQPQVEYWPQQDPYGQPQQPVYDPYQGGAYPQQQPAYDPYTGGYVEQQPVYDAYGQPVQHAQQAQIPQQQPPHYAQQQEVTSFFDTGFIDVSKLREYGQGH